jgi:hypothetical protein
MFPGRQSSAMSEGIATDFPRTLGRGLYTAPTPQCMGGRLVCGARLIVVEKKKTSFRREIFPGTFNFSHLSSLFRDFCVAVRLCIQRGQVWLATLALNASMEMPSSFLQLWRAQHSSRRKKKSNAAAACAPVKTSACVWPY